MTENLQQDTLHRLNIWLEKLEDQARKLLEACQPEELEPVQAANFTIKFITLIVRLLEVRQHFMTDHHDDSERLLKIIFGDEGRLEIDQ